MSEEISHSSTENSFDSILSSQQINVDTPIVVEDSNLGDGLESDHISGNKCLSQVDFCLDIKIFFK